ncbi:MAG: hypothetical protein HOD72_11875 [Opitutae bacterium]|nr:hypothetical protein [Opitutae bacterium]
MANLKEKLVTTHLFYSINPDENALPPAIESPKTPLPILTAGIYVSHPQRARNHPFDSRHKGSFLGKGRKTQAIL